MTTPYHSEDVLILNNKHHPPPPVLPTAASIAPAFFGVIRQYRWRRVGLIVQNENLFTVVSFVVMNPVLIFRECVGLAKI